MYIYTYNHINIYKPRESWGTYIILRDLREVKSPPKLSERKHALRFSPTKGCQSLKNLKPLEATRYHKCWPSLFLQLLGKLDPWIPLLHNVMCALHGETSSPRIQQISIILCRKELHALEQDFNHWDWKFLCIQSLMKPASCWQPQVHTVSISKSIRNDLLFFSAQLLWRNPSHK